MPRLTDHILNNPALNDFLYTILYECPYEFKRTLRGRYLNAAMSAKSARAFADGATIEQKYYMLAKLGLRFFTVIYNDKTLNLRLLKEILEKYENKKTINALKDIADSKLFVTSDKEFIHVLGLVSQSMYHPSFFLNSLLSRSAYRHKDWPKKNISFNDQKMRQQLEDSVTYNRGVLSIIMTTGFSQSLFDISEKELKILLYLYTNMQSYVDPQRVIKYFVGNIDKRGVLRTISHLIKSKLIQKHAINLKEVTIAGLGIQKINDFNDTVFKKETF